MPQSAPKMRARKRGFREPFQNDCAFRPRCMKILLPFFQKNVIVFAHPALTKGYRDRHGRRVREAMDALVRIRRSARTRTAKPCGPDLPTLSRRWDQALRDVSQASGILDRPVEAGR
jgi:hypothetical protein